MSGAAKKPTVIEQIVGSTLLDRRDVIYLAEKLQKLADVTDQADKHRQAEHRQRLQHAEAEDRRHKEQMLALRLLTVSIDRLHALLTPFPAAAQAADKEPDHG